MFSALFHSSDMPSPRPVLDDDLESNVPGLYVVGDLAGSPVVKLAMEQGYQVAHHIAEKPDARGGEGDAFDLLVIGAGAAGLNTALEAKSLGLKVLVLEKSRIGNTVAELPEGKWIYTEPNDHPAVGSLTLAEMTKEELASRWEDDVRENGLDVRLDTAVTGLKKDKSGFEVITNGETYRAKRVVLATGKSSTPRKLGVPGEDLPHVQHKLYHPKKYEGKKIVVVGGGNSAIEAAVSLSEQNEVTLVHRGTDFVRLTKENARRFRQSNVEIKTNARVTGFEEGSCEIDGAKQPCDYAFVLIGSEVPRQFLHDLGLHLENEWRGSPLLAGVLAAGTLLSFALYAGQNPIAGLAGLAGWIALLVLAIRGDRFALIGFSALTAYTIYGVKQSAGHEFWPYTGWGFEMLSFLKRPWSFWYTVLYTVVMTVFGIPAMKRWGFDRKDRFQIWRYVSLLSFQWIFFFLIPEVLFRWAVQYQWVGERLAADPNFASNAWRSYGIIYAWPLFFYTFFGNPNQVWLVWGGVLSFVIIPVLVLFHGKRYCSWICGCGGLAETLGDRWRHLAPKGDRSIAWEKMNAVVLVAAVVITVAVISRDLWTIVAKPADAALAWYHLVADTWLVGIIPVAMYPFFGGKVWCRYWCPLAKMMELFSVAFTRFRVSRFAIKSNDKCIACGDCTRNCQVGIDVMRFALKQEEITNANSSCIGCGICVTVCPMDVLSFAKPESTAKELVQIQGV